MDKRTAIVLGATGLTGYHLVHLLLRDDRFNLIRIFVRRISGIRNPKIEEHIINFDRSEEWKYLVTGDVLFSALGTTLSQAGSKKAQFTVDYAYQYQFAKAAAVNKVPVYVLVSSVGANPNSLFFYTKMKGTLEEDIKDLPFDHIHIFKPGQLIGRRGDKRLGEQVALTVMTFLNRIGFAKKMKPLDVSILAQAMINVSFDFSEQLRTYVLNEISGKASGGEFKPLPK